MKRIRQSLTVWFNSSLALFAALPDVLNMLAGALPSLTSFVPSKYYGPLLITAIVGNLVLRLFFTRKPLTEVASKRP